MGREVRELSHLFPASLSSRKSRDPYEFRWKERSSSWGWACTRPSGSKWGVSLVGWRPHRRYGWWAGPTGSGNKARGADSHQSGWELVLGAVRAGRTGWLWRPGQGEREPEQPVACLEPVGQVAQLGQLGPPG